MCCDHSAPPARGLPFLGHSWGLNTSFVDAQICAKGFGLATFVLQNYQMDPSDSSLFLFCGKSQSQLKALLWEPDGFILLSKQLSNSRCWKS